MYEPVKLWDLSAWASLIRPPGSIPGVGWVRRNETNKIKKCQPKYVCMLTKKLNSWIYYEFASNEVPISSHIWGTSMIFKQLSLKPWKKIWNQFIVGLAESLKRWSGPTQPDRNAGKVKKIMMINYNTIII